MTAVELVPLRYVVSINDEKLSDGTDPNLEFRYLDIGAVGRGLLTDAPETLRFADAPSRARRRVQNGDTIVSTVRTYLRAVWPVVGNTEDLVVSTGFAVMRPRDVDPSFLAWALQADPFIEEVVARSTGVSYPAINPSDIADIEIARPSREAQERIARYLNVETSRVDALIAAKQKMAAVLDSGQREVDERTCLGGAILDFSATSPEFRMVPDRWGATTLRHLRCDVQTGPFGSQLHAAEYVDDGWPVVNPANLRNGAIHAIPGMTVSGEKRHELGRHILQLDDIVFGRRGEMGRAGLVHDEHVGWLCGTGSLRMRLGDQRLRPRYLKLQLETNAARSYFQLQSVGSTMDNLNADIVLGVPVMVPPVPVQENIIERTERTRAASRTAIGTIARQIELLRERRQALITAAVTGEMTV